MPEKRLFFALWPSHRQRELLRVSLRPAMSSVEGNVLDRRNWHITLVFIGAFPEAQIPFLKAAAAEIEPAPIRLRFDRLDYWPRAKVAVLQPLAVPGALETLVQLLESTLKNFDVQPEERVFRPHITVARRARKFDTVHLTRPIDLQWSDFELVESLPSSSGVTYQPLAK
jgi:RNA 2',3'-cyclic 3'-phosphodiesterase